MYDGFGSNIAGLAFLTGTLIRSSVKHAVGVVVAGPFLAPSFVFFTKSDLAPRPSPGDQKRILPRRPFLQISNCLYKPGTPPNLLEDLARNFEHQSMRGDFFVFPSQLVIDRSSFSTFDSRGACFERNPCEIAPRHAKRYLRLRLP